MKMRVADFIIDELYSAGAKHAFLITGGMIMHLADALLQHKKQKFVCCHHEQAAVMAAEAYGRYTSNLGVAYVTAGPAALNALTGVVGAWVDRAPCIIISGQSKVSQATVTGPRQFALQGFNTLPIFQQVAKYAVMLDDITKVKYEIEKCIYLAKAQPFGPVWIECPIDIQGMLFDPDEYDGFQPPHENLDADVLKQKNDLAIEAIKNSSRPVLLLGAGVRSSGAAKVVRKFIDLINMPVLTSRLGMDLIEYDHQLFVGRPGTYGDRAANFAIQNSDLLLVLGCRLGIGLIGHDYKDFAPNAKKIIVDLDEKELFKPSIIPDIPVKADVKVFIDTLIVQLNGYRFDNQKWIDKTQNLKHKYTVDLPEYLNEKDGINSYHFISEFSKKMSKDDAFLVDTGSCFHVHAQAFKVKLGQRHIITGGLSTMGYMPAAIGVAKAVEGRGVYCITGDGSMQMNIQELQTIVYNKLPIKLIVLSNAGYLLIRQTQNNFMEGRLIGEGPRTGVGLPDLKKVADCYGIDYLCISKLSELEHKLNKVVNTHGPLICEVITPADQQLIPRVSSRKLEDGSIVSMPYDDMFPFLDRDEYRQNCMLDV